MRYSGLSSTRNFGERFLVFVALAIFFSVASPQWGEAFAQESASVQQNEGLQKALKYHKALVRRPAPGYLFDRFYNSWLDSSSLEDLGQFLTDNAVASSKTADRLLLAFFHAKAGDDVKALEQFREALKNDPGNAATLYEKAVVEARTLDFETALTDLAAASTASPSAEDAIKIAQLRGKLLVRNRQTKEAIEVWDALLKANPGDAGLLEDMVEVLIAEGLYDQANKWSDKLIAISKDPFQKVTRQLRKGDIFQRSGKRTKALEVYETALDKVGMDSWLEREILGQIDQLFRREDDLVGLGEHLSGMIKKNDKRLAVRKAASKIQMELGMPDQAIATFQKIVELTPGDRANREAFVSLLLRAEQTEKAVKQMEALASQNASDAELQVRLAELYHKVSQSDKAKTAVEKFISLSENSEYGYLRAAKLFEKFSDIESATATYAKAMTTFAESDAVKESWATFLFRSGKKKEAVDVWKALAKDCDRAGLVRIARIASTRKENQAAMDMLLARFDELKFDRIYLGQLCVEAIALKKFKVAVPWAIERVRLSKTAGDIDSCMNPSVEIISSAEQANEVVERLQSKDARNAPETCLLVELLERSLQSTEADAVLAKSIELANAAKENDASQILARQKVRLLVSRQDWTAAADAAREMIDLPGGRKSVNVRQLVELYARSGDEKSALQWVGEWKRLSPGSLLPWFNESSLLERSGKYKEAINALRAATRKFENEPDLFAQLAQKYLNNGQVNDAKRIFWRQYDESEKLSDKLRWAERLASMADDYGNVEELVSKFEERRKNNPKSIGPLLAIAQAHRVADNYEERRTALLEATRLQKDNFPLLMEIARMEESEGDWEKAIETLERAKLLDKTNQAAQKIARIYIEYGETKEGLVRLLEVVGGASSTARDVEKIAGSIVDVEDWEQLRDFISPQVDRFKTDYRLKYLLAISNEELGYTAEARKQFLELLSFKDEIPGLAVGSNSMQRYFQRQFQDMKGTLPDEALEFMDLMTQSTEMAYAYREEQNSYRYSPFSSGGSMAYLPESVAVCRKCTIAHLRTLSENYSESEKNTLRSELIRAGIANVDLVLSDYNEDNITRDPAAILSVDPENEIALAIATMAAVRQGGLEEADLVRSYDAFKDDYPTLSFFAAMQMDLAVEENQKRFKSSLEKLGAIENPSATMVMPIAQKLVEHDASGDGADTGIGKYRSELNALISNWYSRMKPGQASSWMFSQVVNSFRNEKSQKRFIEFLDGELVRSKDQNKKQANSWNPFSSRYGNRNGLSVSLPVFPPNSLLSFPRQVYKQLKLSAPDNFDRFNYDPFGSSDDAKPMTKAEIAEASQIAKDPTLKALLQVKYFSTDAKADEAESDELPFGEQIQDAKSALDALLASDRTNIDAWYLAATLAAGEKRWEDAVDQFEKMRSLPMNAQYRSLIDGHLVAIATQGLVEGLEAKENEKVLMSSKSAALRLRRGRLSQEDRLRLVSIFETLGLNEEAEKMESRIVSSSSGGGGGRMGMSSPAATSRAAELADSGKNDAASRLLSQEFRTLARSALNFDQMGNSMYEMQEFQSKLSEMGLKKELMAQLKPGESASTRQLSTWAYAVEKFSGKKEAVEAYKKLLESNPTEDEARLRLLLIQSSMGEDTFAEHFPKVNKRKRSLFLPALFNSIGSNDLQGDQILNVVEPVLKYLESANDSDFKDYMWVRTMLAQTAGPLPLKPNDYQFRTPSLYAMQATAEEEDSEKESARDKKKREKLNALLERQRSIHDRLARKMVDLPGVSASGFTALLASREAVGTPVDDELIELALKSVYPEKKSKFAAMQHQMYRQTSMGGYYGGSSKSVTKRTPAVFLARHYGFDAGNHDDQIEVIATKLESLKAKPTAAKLRSIYRLCKASEGQYLDVASEQVDEAKGGSRRTKAQLWQAVMRNVVEIWKDRELNVDISGLVLDYAGRDQSSSAGYGGYGYGGNGDPIVSGFLATVFKKEGLAGTSDFLTKLRTSMLGDEEQQAKLVELLEDEKKVARSRKKLMPLMQYLSTVQGMANTKEAFFLSVKEVSRFKIPGMGRGQNLGYRLTQAIEKFKPSEAEEFLAWLDSGNLLGDLENFDPIYQRGDDQTGSVWGEALEGFSYRVDEELKKAVLAKLEQKKDFTFGESVLIAFLKERRPSIYNIMGKEVEAFEGLSEEKQSELATFAAQLYSNAQNMGPRKISLTPEAKRVSKICAERLRASMGSLVEKVLEAKRFSDLGVEEYSFDEWSANLLGSLDRSDSEKVLSVISKVADLTKNTRNVFRSNDVSPRSTLVANTLTEIDMDSMKILLDILENKDFSDFTIESQLSDRVAEFLKKEFETLRATVDKTTPKTENNQIAAKTLDALQTRLGDALGDRQMFGLFSPLQRLYSRLTASERNSIDSWFKLEATGKHPKIGASLRLAWLSMRDVMLRADSKSNSKNASESKEEAPAVPRLAEPLPYQSELLAYVKDDSVPIQARLPVAMSIASNDERLPVQDVWASFQTINAAMEAKAKLDDARVVKLFQVAIDLDSDAAFAESAGGFAKKWAQAKIKSSQSGGFYSSWSSEGKPTVGAIRILAKTDNLPILKKLLASDQDSSDAGILVALIEAGLNSEARKRSQMMWRDSSVLNSIEHGSQAYSKQLEEGLPEFVELFKTEGEKLFANIFFASFENAKEADAKVESKPRERLAELSKRFPGTEFKSKRTRQLAMILLSGSPDASSAIREPLGELASDLNLEQLVDNNSNSDMQMKLLAAWLGVEAQFGNFEPVRDVYRKVNGLTKEQLSSDSNPFEDNWQVRNLLSSVSESMSKSFSKQIESDSPNLVENLLPVLAELNEPTLQYKLSPELNVLAHLVAGRTDELIKAWESAPKEDKGDEDSSYSGPDMDDFLKQVQKFADGKELEGNQRAKLVLDVWNLGAKGKFSIGSGHFQDGVQESCSGCSKSKFAIEQLAELKLLDDAQILEIGPQLAELNSVYGEVWRQVAKRQFAAEMFDQASESFRKALDASGKDMDQAKFNRKVEYANALVKLGRNEEAKKQLEKIEPDELLGDNGQTYDQLKTTLNLK